MKISFDLDGTAFDFVEFFCFLSHCLKNSGHQVGVLTGHKHDADEHDRKKLINLGFPELDFYFGRTPEYMHLNGAHFKSMVIRREGIDIHFDDYDYDNADTVRLFATLGQELKIFRVKSDGRNRRPR